jgi:hypothetical protein
VTMNIGPLVLTNSGPPPVSLTCGAGPRPGSAGQRRFSILSVTFYRPSVVPWSGGTDRSPRLW